MGAPASERAHARAALAEIEARFGRLAQLAPVGIVQTDAAGRAIFVNDRWCAMTGVPAAGLVGTSWLDLLHPDDRGQVERDIAGAGDHGDVHIDGRLRTASGTEIWVQGAAVALRDADGSAGMLAAFTDISERKRAEVERERLLAAEQAANVKLADQTERMNCLIAAAIPGVLVTDERGLITHANKSFGALYGIEFPDRLVGTPAAKTVRAIKHAFADPGEFVRRISAAFAARQPAEGQRITAADGRTLECDYWPVLAGGRYRGDIWLAWDISDRIKQEEARTDFVATVSHELRTPLTSIVSFTELIRAETGGLSRDGVHFLDIIQRNANRLIRLVGDLLLLNQLESGMVPLELAPVSVPELTGEAVRDASAAAAGYGVTLEAGPADGPAVRGDHLRLRQVLDNLIANAVKFSHPGDTVRVLSAWDGRVWRIDVTDSGIGIPAEEIGHLFDRFVRASNARTSGRPGTGLGLSVVKTIVELHGGRIVVDSTLDSGTTFSIYLPVTA